MQTGFHDFGYAAILDALEAAQSTAAKAMLQQLSDAWQIARDWTSTDTGWEPIFPELLGMCRISMTASYWLGSLAWGKLFAHNPAHCIQ